MALTSKPTWVNRNLKTHILFIILNQRPITLFQSPGWKGKERAPYALHQCALKGDNRYVIQRHPSFIVLYILTPVKPIGSIGVAPDRKCLKRGSISRWELMEVLVRLIQYARRAPLGTVDAGRAKGKHVFESRKVLRMGTINGARVKLGICNWFDRGGKRQTWQRLARCDHRIGRSMRCYDGTACNASQRADTVIVEWNYYRHERKAFSPCQRK